jgi:hypothetical protein
MDSVVKRFAHGVVLYGAAAPARITSILILLRTHLCPIAVQSVIDYPVAIRRV